MKLTKNELPMLVTRMMYENNLIWGRATGCVVDTNHFDDIDEAKKKSLIDALKSNAIKSRTQSLHGIIQHEDWQKTAPKDHPSNKPYSELPFEVQMKDVMFKHFALMLEEIRSNLEDEMPSLDKKDF